MVKKENSVFLFAGEDSFSKDIKLKKLRQEAFPKEVEQFNLDILYAKELNLRDLQEKILCLPVRAKKRLIVIKDAEGLKEDIQEFIIKFLKNPSPWVILVLDINRLDSKNEFINCLTRYGQVYHFQEATRIDTFTLSRSIEQRHADYSLRLLHQLLRNKERPERILGGLRYSWERNITNPLERRKRLKLLLNCDIDIKTGRLKPQFALEKLVVNLCALNKS